MRPAPLAVLFDLDGTLVDSLLDIATLMNATLASHGLPTHPVDAYRRFVGRGITVLAERASEGSGADVAALVAELRARYRAAPVTRTRPYDGVAELLAALRARGLPLAVLSNKPHELSVAIVERLFATGTFALVLGQREDTPRKPDPSAALALAHTLGVAPERCAFVGDTDVDVITATRAGMLPVGVAWGFQRRDALVAAGAAHILERPEDFLVLLA